MDSVEWMGSRRRLLAKHTGGPSVKSVHNVLTVPGEQLRLRTVARALHSLTSLWR